MTTFDIAYANACELTLPRTSGPSVNVHVIKAQPVPTPNYEKMRLQIQGDQRVKPVDK